MTTYQNGTDFFGVPTEEWTRQEGRKVADTLTKINDGFAMFALALNRL